MITFSHLGRHGRLGNQLFQYAALRSLSLERGYECKIPDPKQVNWHGQQCLLSEFNIECDYLSEDDMHRIEFIYFEQNISKFDRNFFRLGDGVNLHGYFQSTMYFDKFKSQVIKELTPKEEYTLEAKEFIESQRAHPNQQIVSVHIRMGDLIDGTCAGYDNLYGKDNLIDTSSVYGQYFSQALHLFGDIDCKFLVFCGGSRTNDMEDSNFMNCFDDRFYLSSSESPLQDFSRMMMCDHNICGHLTTFGWWAAYLNCNDNKIVAMPKNYFYNDRISREGFFADNWVTL